MNEKRIKLYEKSYCPFCKKKSTIYEGESIMYHFTIGKPLEDYYQCERCLVKFVVQTKEIIFNIKRIGGERK